MSYRDYEMKIANLEEELELQDKAIEDLKEEVKFDDECKRGFIQKIKELIQKNDDLQISLTGALETADYYKNGYETLEEEANNHFDFLKENEGVQANLNADLSQRHSEDLAIIKKLEEENEKEIRLLYKVFEYLLSKLEK